MALNTMNETAKVERVTALYRASCTFDRAVELARCVNRMADKLCGAEPTDTGKMAIPPANDGVFPAIEATCRSVDYEIENAFHSLDRIEGELP